MREMRREEKVVGECGGWRKRGRRELDKRRELGYNWDSCWFFLFPLPINCCYVGVIDCYAVSLTKIRPTRKQASRIAQICAHV